MIKRILLVFTLFGVFQIAHAQHEEFQVISYTEFFKLIEQETDSVFKLSTTIIKYNSETDSRHWYTTDPARLSEMRTDTIVVQKRLNLNNVHFDATGGRSGTGLHHIHFTKEVILMNSASALFDNCLFDGLLMIFNDPPTKNGIEWLESNAGFRGTGLVCINSQLKSGLDIVIQSANSPLNLSVMVEGCLIFSMEVPRRLFIYRAEGVKQSIIGRNRFYGYHDMSFQVSGNEYLSIYENEADQGNLNLAILEGSPTSNVYVMKNHWPGFVFFEADELNSNANLGWDQWNNKIHSSQGYSSSEDWQGYRSITAEEIDSMQTAYVDQLIYENEDYFNMEVKLLGQFLDLYKSQHNSKASNQAFMAIKNLETTRLKYLYDQEPSFDTYFQWKVNSFLKVFSDYGTKPSKAIIFSLYVILSFALFYLFTPNSWDTLNQNRLIRRIRFFTKYFRRDDGISDVYEEENKEGIMDFEEFRQYMEESKKEIPRYFLHISKPLYYFSLSNYKMTSSLLSKMDILKGKWAELPPRRKTSTSILMAIWLVIMILFDISIKILNALILSLNTFTTLGFGEIPIKGVARYLAIIQGFIGWFMLSLFSVSLISQLMH